MADELSAERERRFWKGVEQAGAFFMGESPVQKAMLQLDRLLTEAGIDHAVIGAMSLNEYGYVRVTTDVDVLITREGLERFKQAHLGKGYTEKFPGSRGVRDTVNGVPIDFVLAGDFPGDGKPKPVAFPDPAIAVRGKQVSLLPLERLVELKLASGLSSAARLKDLADVQELIKAAQLPESLAQRLDGSVRAKYQELWAAAQVKDPYAEE